VRVQLSARDSSHTFECNEGETILRAGLRHGVGLPYECASGTCGTCKAALADGEVDEGWGAAPGRTFLKADGNEILMCQAAARTDCTLTVRGRVRSLGEADIVPGCHSGVLESVTPLNRDVFRLDVRLGAPIAFDAGQFMLVGHADFAGQRGLSMANFERPTDHLVFTVKLKAAGGLSDWLSGRDRTGARLDLFGPLGSAIYRAGEVDGILCIAGGSGLAPMLSILELARSVGHFAAHDGHIFFGARTLDDLYGVDELMAVRAAFPERVSLTIALSEEAPDAGPESRWPGVAFAAGFVHEVAGLAMAGKYDGVTAYLAGPPPMVEGAMRMLVSQAKLPPTRIRYDKFS
jgi:toluene monooxygenase electron transfer component